jgi:hypothetical protein
MLDAPETSDFRGRIFESKASEINFAAAAAEVGDSFCVDRCYDPISVRSRFQVFRSDKGITLGAKG